MKVYLAAFGSGMGHASRMATLAGALTSSGDEVKFSSSGEVTAWLRNKGYACNDIPLVDVSFTEAGNFSATKTLNFLPVTIAHLCEQVQMEVANIRGFAPDVVLSDSVASTLVASKLMRVRSVALLNQLRLVSSPKTPGPIAAVLTGASVAIGGAFWGLCENILVPDLPPPYTISERNLWSAGKSSRRAKYIGFLTPKRSRAALADLPEQWLVKDGRRRVFWQISGPPATRGPFLLKALQAAKALEKDYLFVITSGDPRGRTSPSPIAGGYLYEWCPAPGVFLDSCDAVVSRAGHVSLSDYVLRGKPSLLVPIQAQTEQMGNASKAERLGIALAMEETALEPGAVNSALRELSSESYAKKAREMKSVAEGYDALRSITDVLRKA